MRVPEEHESPVRIREDPQKNSKIFFYYRNLSYIWIVILLLRIMASMQDSGSRGIGSTPIGATITGT